MKKRKRASEKELTNVSIPTSLYERIKEKIKETGFTSVSNYVTYVLRESFAEKEEAEEPFTKENEEKIKARLRALGYID
jgi:Arc/MetJ-type ribon-helix-helix transcriptional regulator